MYNDRSDPILTNCIFSNNSTFSDLWPNAGGGGMYNYGSSPELTNCTFSENSADSGGGICNSTSDTILTNCTFSGNKARDGGGMMNATYSYPTVTNCNFSRNEARGDGGGMVNGAYSFPTVTNCIFRNNTAGTRGGGICIRYGSAHISRCTFEDNWAYDGGGLFNEGGRLWLENCTFTRNVASGLQYADVGYGGGLHIESHLVGSNIDNCIFIANIASVGGGAHFGYRGMAIPLSRGEKTLLTGCNFVRNKASWGGAIGQSTSTLDIEHCVFRENSALYTGGAISTLSSITNFANCIFSGNSASIEGASILARGIQEVKMHGHESPQNFKLTLDSCTLRGNRTAIGQSLACRSHNSEDLDSTLISNCILHNNGNEIHNPDGSHMTISYTNLRGGVSSVHDPCEAVIWGEGNIDVDPCFAKPGYWDPNGTPDDVNDDFWVDGDYHLKTQAGRYDPDTQSWVQDDVTSPCIDAGDPDSCLGFHEPYPNGLLVNMGAYGGTAEASMSLSPDKCVIPWWAYDYWVEVGEPICWCYKRQCHGDADCKHQGKQKYWVSTNDLDVLIAAWNKTFAEIEGEEVNGVPLICADFDHIPQGKAKYPVSTMDLDILITYWNIANKPEPDCP